MSETTRDPQAGAPAPTVRRGRWWRRLGWVAVGVFVVLLVGVLTVDFWVPALGSRLAGVDYAERETEWGREVSGRGVRWAGYGVELKAERLSFDAPSRMVWGGGVANARVEGWTLTIEAPRANHAGNDAVKARRTGGGDFDWPDLIGLLEKIGGHLARRVERAELLDGTILVVGEVIDVSRFVVRGALAEGEVRWRQEVFTVKADLTTGAAEVAWLKGEAVVLANVPLEAQAATETPLPVAGELRWAGNTAAFAVTFPERGWRPREFELEGAAWTVPAARLGVGFAAEYADPRGDFSLRSEGDGARVVVTAEALPRGPDLPPVRIDAEVWGEPALVRLERLLVESPQARARLSTPLIWRVGEGWVTVDEPVFEWSADLGALSAARVTGRVEGTARWIDGPAWRVEWAALAAGVSWGEFADFSAKLEGETTAEFTRVNGAEVNSADGATEVEVSGTVYHAERRIEAAKVDLAAPGALLTPWLPEGLAVGALVLTATADGGWLDPQVAAAARVEGLAFKNWAAERVELKADGQRSTGWRVEAGLGQGAAAVQVVATVNEQPLRVVAETFSVRRGDGRTLELVQPAELRWGPDVRTLAAEWAASAAGGEKLAASWADGMGGALSIQNLNTGWAADWWTGEVWPQVAVRDLQVAGRVGEGQWLAGEGRVDVVWSAAGKPAAWVRVDGALGADGFALGQLELGQAQETLASGKGNLPWRVSAAGRAEPVAGGEWSLRLASRAEATLWDELAKLAGIALERPSLELELHGPAEEPSGRVELSAERLGFSGEGLPEGGIDLRALRLVATATRGEWVVKELRGEVDGQIIEAEGRVAIGADDWDELRERPYVWLRDHAEGRVRLPEAQMSALARYLPTLLAPSGTLTAELLLTKGANLDGRLLLYDGATRPLGGFGVLKEIEVELLLRGRDVRIGRMQAVAGGQAVAITGGARRDPGKMPVLDLQVKAERFPLVRSTGLLLRGDLDLTIKTATRPDGSAGATRVGGEVRLRDSLFLADIRPLIGAGGSGAPTVQARPPYFSVNTPPLAEWELALRVGGDGFIRMRTPIFEGTGSARFDLTGTLREPRAIGEFWVDQGNILFPFASFAVLDGAVRLSASDPYTPVLDFQAGGRRLGYDMRLELTGTANAPVLQMFSSPPLAAESLLLMVTAGVPPRDGSGGASSATQRLAAVGAYVGRDLLRSLGLVGGGDEERLTLISGEQISRQGKETYGFEYRFSERWSVAGEYDEFDAYNVGLKRNLRPAPPLPPTQVETTPRPEGNRARGSISEENKVEATDAP